MKANNKAVTKLIMKGVAIPVSRKAIGYIEVRYASYINNNGITKLMPSSLEYGGLTNINVEHIVKLSPLELEGEEVGTIIHSTIGKVNTCMPVKDILNAIEKSNTYIMPSEIDYKLYIESISSERFSITKWITNLFN